MKIIKNCDNVTGSNKVVSCDNQNLKLDACNHIQSAIDCLGQIAKDDEVAKDSIANLGVVLLDLK